MKRLPVTFIEIVLAISSPKVLPDKEINATKTLTMTVRIATYEQGNAHKKGIAK
jgi:hypothetical protein